MLPNQVNRCRTGAVGSPTGLSSATAKAITTTTATTVWSSEPVPGAPLVPLVRPKAAGSRPSRPMAKAYRATTLWKLSRAANMPVTNRTCRTSVKVPPRRDSVRKNSSPALCFWDVPTMAEGPVATVRAQLLSAKNTATPPTARNITRGTRTCGRLVSSAYTGACSKPRNAAMQKHSAVPTPAPVRVSGLKACSDRPSWPGSARAATSKTTTRSTSMTSSTPSTRALTSIFSQPSRPTASAATRAGIHQATSISA